MQILIADDEIISRKLLQGALAQLGHECVAVADGSAAIEVKESQTARVPVNNAALK